jgi:hypothetical protein
MVLKPVGEFDIEVDVNGTNRISETISSDKTGSDAYNITESHNVTVNVNGNQRKNENITSDTTYNISESLSPSVYVNGGYEGSETISNGDNIEIDASVGNMFTQDFFESETYTGPEDQLSFSSNDGLIFNLDVNMTNNGGETVYIYERLTGPDMSYYDGYDTQTQYQPKQLDVGSYGGTASWTRQHCYLREVKFDESYGEALDIEYTISWDVLDTNPDVTIDNIYTS